MSKPKLIVIAGPTASGKTDYAIAIAKKFQGEVISADSRTIFQEMNIGTAKPYSDTPPYKGGASGGQSVGIHVLFADKPLLVEGIPHWGFDLVSPNESFTVADFKVYADKKIQEIIKRGKLPILAGGTGLYIKAVVDNLSFTETPPNEELRQSLEKLSNEELLARISDKDSETAETIDTANRRRLLRAVEVIESTGKPLREQQTAGKQKYDALLLGIQVDRDVLNERIDLRVDQMIGTGLVDEVRVLKEKYDCEVNAMTGIGYRQICAFLSGYMKLSDAIEVIKQDTRHYAKRQLTWFRADERIQWVCSVDEAIDLADKFI